VYWKRGGGRRLGGGGEKGCIYEGTEIGKEVQVLGRGEEIWE
jgi:hypothetical protein